MSKVPFFIMLLVLQCSVRDAMLLVLQCSVRDAMLKHISYLCLKSVYFLRISRKLLMSKIAFASLKRK